MLANLILFIPSFRLLFIRPIVVKLFNHKKSLIGDSEKVAMESGNTHWESQLFSNQLDWNELLSVKSKPLSNQEQAFIDDQVSALCDTFNQFGLTDKTLSQIKSKGFWALNIPKKYGGLAFSAKAHAKILTQLSSCDVSLAVTVMVPNSLGPAELISHYGTDQQKQNLLPKLATGEHIPCFALTSTEAGSDAGAMTDSGVVCYQSHQGEKTLGILLNWDKRYTTLAPIATLIGLAFKTYDPDGLIGKKVNLGITCALVDSVLAGISIGRYHHPIGSEFSNGPHQGRDVFIPMSALIGGQAMIGQGWVMLMESLSLGRGVSLPSLSLSGAQLSLKTSIEYALIRKQFKQSLYHFQGVAEKIVPMAADVLVMKAMSDFHLSLLDQGFNPSISSAILKYHHTELLRVNVNRAMDIHGGKTVMLGKRNYLANIYQSIPIAIVVEGANILTRSMIIFGQGLMRCHPFLKDELTSLENKDYVSFNKTLGKHLAYLSTVKAKSFIFALSNGKVAIAPKNTKSITKPYYQQLSSISASFAFLVEMALIKHGSNIKFQESMNGLFADLLIKMYGISTLLKYAETLDSHFNDLLKWTAQSHVYESQLLLKEICDQFKYTWAFKWLVLPRGVNQTKPSIDLQNKIINQLIHDENLKEDLTNDVLLIKDTPLDELEQTYKLALKAEEIYKNVKHIDTPEAIDALLNQEKITSQKHQVLSNLTQLRRQILKVDDYEN
ncbi:acyl-CoA dehydrogenase [Abyssogena phaseoliformis symbiont OG214]|uniref:acyl-CoA dehydrogenase n=1 Tax=Abyssogena phaseoliformis symbiont TaxID=596095 RepID=UPI001938084C|nr:acyl-CoA dehydrogenase [Abyssogena phaseoliformis symbiont]MBW5289245.1 Butyryl-CoA dehydrogenase [Candidatus Ruthia sp. Apha_13_S6]BBB22728.1 acyl-CoA dehydrogenase [Abyssogena phaseoliformis symbiont OG214]